MRCLLHMHAFRLNPSKISEIMDKYKKKADDQQKKKDNQQQQHERLVGLDHQGHQEGQLTASIHVKPAGAGAYCARRARYATGVPAALNGLCRIVVSVRTTPTSF